VATIVIFFRFVYFFLFFFRLFVCMLGTLSAHVVRYKSPDCDPLTVDDHPTSPEFDAAVEQCFNVSGSPFIHGIQYFCSTGNAVPPLPVEKKDVLWIITL
jgi:hypothetical protein